MKNALIILLSLIVSQVFSQGDEPDYFYSLKVNRPVVECVEDLKSCSIGLDVNSSMALFDGYEDIDISQSSEGKEVLELLREKINQENKLDLNLLPERAANGSTPAQPAQFDSFYEKFIFNNRLNCFIS